MNIFTAVAVLVSILGVFLILAIVWLVYKFNAKRVAEAANITAEPPIRKLIIHRGRVVPASRLVTPSIRSGWSSLKHRSWLLSSPSLPRSDGSVASFSRSGSVRRPYDLESGRFQKEPSYPDMRTVLHSQGSAPSLSHTFSEKAPSITSLNKSPVTQFWNKQYPKTATIEEKTLAARSFLNEPSADALPNFPRPPYLSPLQSRYHIRRAYQPQSPLSHTFAPIDHAIIENKELQI